MNKLFVLSLLFVIGFSSNSWSATSGICGEKCTWEIKNGVLEISGTGNMTSSFGNDGVNQPWKAERENITSIKVNEGITSIGGRAFAFLSKATSISLPNTLISIKESALYKTNIQEINIPQSVENIEYHVFTGVPLNEIVLPENLKELDIGAFESVNLDSLIIPANTKIVVTRELYNNANIKNVLCNEANEECLAYVAQYWRAKIKTYTYDENTGRYIIDGKKYRSVTDMQNGKTIDDNPVPFYTVETANDRINEIGDCDDPHQFGCSFKIWLK